jgi:tetratricopeptide (TPR) repeat protein
VDQIVSWSGDGRVTTLVSRLIDAATKQNKLDSLTRELSQAVESQPGWSGGKAMLAILQTRQGQAAVAKPVIESLLADDKNEMPLYAHWVIAQEIENQGPLQDLALSIHEKAAKLGENDQNMEFSYHPAKRLVSLYQRAGRTAEARELVLKFAKRSSDSGYDPQYAAYRRINDLNSIGTQLLELGYPADAVRVFNEVLGDDERLQLVRQWYGGREQFTDQAVQGLNRALQGLNAETLGRTLRELLKPPVNATPTSETVARSASEGANGPAVDLVLIVQPRDLDRALVSSMLASAIQSAGATPELLTEVNASVEKLLEQHGQDLSVQIAAALSALAAGKPEAITDSLQRLVKVVDDTPLEELPAGSRANARQRAEAAKQIGLWLVTRELGRVSNPSGGPRKMPDLSAVADKLAARALQAARRQSDSSWSLAMLRELGQLALDRGDRATAERHWTEMLEIVLPSRPATTKPKADRSATAPPVTIDRFEQAARIAKLAAEQQMRELSLRAVRESLRAGPPIRIEPTNTQGRRVSRSVGPLGESSEDQSLNQQVEARLFELENLWRRHKVPPEQVYETLLMAVLPESRPAEVFLYSLPLANSPQRPRSVGVLLARSAAAAHKCDDLRGRIEARAGQPLAELSAKVLLAMLGQAARDNELTSESLGWLAERLERDTLQTTAELACHAAMPALHAAATSDAACPVVERATKNMAVQQSVNEEPIGSLMFALARLRFERKEFEAGRKQLQDYLNVIDRTLSRYGGDYGPHRRKQVVARIGAEYVRAGLLTDALDMLGQVADAPQTRYGGDQPLGGLAAALASQIRARPAAERYELLQGWVMPTDTRKSVRLLAAFVPTDGPPAVFAGVLPLSSRGAGQGEGGQADGALHQADDVVSTASLLVEAAREAGTLDELSEQLQTAADEKVENARVLHLLAQIARGQPEAVAPVVKHLAAEIPKKTPNQNERKPIEWSNYLLARTCATEPNLRDIGEQMLKDLIVHSQRVQDHLFMTHLRHDLATSTVARAGSQTPASADPGLALWHVAAQQNAGMRQAGSVPAWWVAHEGLLKHIAGPSQDFLYFDYPLTGEFEFTIENFIGGWGEGGVGYGGLLFEHTLGGSSQIGQIGNTQWSWKPFRFAKYDAFNRWTIQVRPDKVRYLLNGHQFHEDLAPSPTSPWLALFGSRERETAYRNPVMTGAPQIPREVRLTHEDRLEGWIAGFYNETQQPPRVGRRPQDKSIAAVAPGLDEYDWSARNGVVRGRRSEPVAQIDPVQSRLYYHRPLRSSESVRYEFYYEPDSIVVHPALDRLTFLLESDGVRLHWMTDGPDDLSTRLKTDNAIDEPSSRRGPERLPLKPGEWNSVKLSLIGKGTPATAVLELNGEEIYERELEPTNDRLFALFHWKDRTEAQVRNVVLSGDWPEQLAAEQFANLTVRAPGVSDAAAGRARVALMNEEMFSRAADSVLRQARSMPADDRFQFLSRWVLPTEGRGLIRMHGTASPTDPAPPVAASDPFRLSQRTAGRRDQLGGTLESPAIDLVTVAKQLGKLAELTKQVEYAPANSNLEKRAKLAMQVLLCVAEERDDEAAPLLEQLQTFVKEMAPDTSRWERWPELIAQWTALNRPNLHPASMALSDRFVDQMQVMNQKNIQFPGRFDWQRQFIHSRGRGTLLGFKEGEAKLINAGLKSFPWAPVTHVTATTRGDGAPVPQWFLRWGMIQHAPGHWQDFLYLGVPLRGNFEVSCELTAWGDNQQHLAYGGRLVSVVWDLKNLDVSHFGRSDRRIALDPTLERLPDWYPYRMVVQDGTLSFYLKDRKIYEERLPTDPDPWLAIHQVALGFSGVRNLRITGDPQIPEELNLSTLPDLTGWVSYYDEPLTGDNRAWEKRGEEIIGRAFTDLPGSKQESVLQYHRPMLEDGETEYEFFYEPGKAATHPALDRLVLLLDPDGVKLHWLTDAQHDRTGLAPDNVIVEPENRRGPTELPLRPREWNCVKLTLAGDTITIRVNGELVYERELERTNQRSFGLFHYADETEVRVRDVTYRGAWPRTLPGDQELFTLGTPRAEAGR